MTVAMRQTVWISRMAQIATWKITNVKKTLFVYNTAWKQIQLNFYSDLLSFYELLFVSNLFIKAQSSVGSTVIARLMH